ncbi:MAG: hypothetical protein HW390_2160 [Candidatus Brocadiaceae bacterium]|nr:hypothetical protein [Candidatus Brocadiaceae bacterium]
MGYLSCNSLTNCEGDTKDKKIACFYPRLTTSFNFAEQRYRKLHLRWDKFSVPVDIVIKYGVPRIQETVIFDFSSVFSPFIIHYLYHEFLPSFLQQSTNVVLEAHG